MNIGENMIGENMKEGPHVSSIKDTNFIQCRIKRESGSTEILVGISGDIKKGIIVALSCPAMEGEICSKSNKKCLGSNIPKY